MNPSSRNAFQARYAAALSRHVRRKPSAWGSSRAARLLGRDAAALGIGATDLAALHLEALAESAVESPAVAAGAFLLEALRPIEQAQLDACAAACDARLRVEARLEEEAARYGELLARSRRLAHQFLRAQEEERKEISRELHDEVAQILAGVNVRLATLKEVSVVGARSLEQSIALTQRLVEQSIKVVHRYARKLRPAMLDDLGLVPSLRSFIKDLPGSKDLSIRFTAFPEVEELDNARRTVLYRIAQEALTNVSRHAQASRVTVRIRKVGESARLDVRDDGKSFAVDSVLASNTGKRLGLVGMRERVEMVGGRFTIVSKPGKGTTVSAEIPFRNQRKAEAKP